MLNFVFIISGMVVNSVIPSLKGYFVKISINKRVRQQKEATVAAVYVFWALAAKDLKKGVL